MKLKKFLEELSLIQDEEVGRYSKEEGKIKTLTWEEIVEEVKEKCCLSNERMYY